MIFESASFREKREEGKEAEGEQLKHQKSNSSVMLKNANAP